MVNNPPASSNVREAREDFSKSDIIVAEIVHPPSKGGSEIFLFLRNGVRIYYFFSSLINVKSGILDSCLSN